MMSFNIWRRYPRDHERSTSLAASSDSDTARPTRQGAEGAVGQTTGVLRESRSQCEHAAADTATSAAACSSRRGRDRPQRRVTHAATHPEAAGPGASTGAWGAEVDAAAN